MRDFLISRRRLLFTAGSGVLGVTVLNTLSGCSPADPAPSGPTSAASPSAGAASAPAGGWQRVNLSFVSAYLLVRGGEAAVVDTGTPGSGSAIEKALQAAGSGWDAVRHVILTHQHDDHAGGIADVAPQVNAVLYAGQEDLAAITSPKPLKPVGDGDEVFGLQIIGTPGHTAGHICVFDPSTGTLVAGDALNNDGRLTGANPQYTADMKAAAESVRKLAGLEVTTILPGHGEPLTTGAAEALQKLAESLPAS
jgi:glyoxylase-like metal-dependent hydrolase (beta-lactamase superfamily II)